MDFHSCCLTTIFVPSCDYYRKSNYYYTTTTTKTQTRIREPGFMMFVLMLPRNSHIFHVRTREGLLAPVLPHVYHKRSRLIMKNTELANKRT